MNQDWVTLEEAARQTGVSEEDLRAAIVIGNLAGKMTVEGQTFVIQRENAAQIAALVRAMRFNREHAPRASSGDWICRVAALIGIVIGGHLCMEMLVRAYFMMR